MRFRGKDALQFTITTNDFSLNVKSAEALKEQWSKIGLNINVNVVASAEFEKNHLRTRNFEALLCRKQWLRPRPIYILALISE